MIKINNLEQMEKYYNSGTNIYEFVKNDERLDVKFEIDIKVDSDIYARNINAGNINARNINAGNINARDINAGDIKAGDIKTWNINAGDINAWDIKAWNINAAYIDAVDISAGDINAVDISACNIKAGDISAGDIDAGDIDASDISARDISYYAVCVAYANILCTKIEGNRENSKHFCLDGEITIKGQEEEITLAEVCKKLGKNIKIIK